MVLNASNVVGNSAVIGLGMAIFLILPADEEIIGSL
jgi:hypothetical protein